MTNETKSRLKRTADHVIAGLTISAPVNAMSVYALSSVISSPLMLALSTTAFATLFSGVRIYAVMSHHEAQSRAETL